MTTEKTGATDATDATSDGESSQGNGEEVQTTDEAIVSTAPTDGEPLATDGAIDGEPSRGNEEEVATAPTLQTDATSGATDGEPLATDAPTLQTDEAIVATAPTTPAGASDGESNSTATDALDGETPASTPTTDEAGVATATGGDSDSDVESDSESVGALNLPNDGEPPSKLPVESDSTGSTSAREYFGDDFLVELAGKVAGAYRKTFNLDLDKYEEARQDAALFLLSKARIDPSLGRERCVRWLRKRAFGELVRAYQNANGLRRKERPPKRASGDVYDLRIPEKSSNKTAADVRELDKRDLWREAVKFALANLEVDESAALEEIERTVGKEIVGARERVARREKLVDENATEKRVVWLSAARRDLEKLVARKARLVDESTRDRRIVRAILDSKTSTEEEGTKTFDEIAADFGVSSSKVCRAWAAFRDDCKNELQYSPLLRSKTPVLERNS